MQPTTRHFRALHASFSRQALWRCWLHFPVGLGTCPHCPKYQNLVQWPWCYCAWLASWLAWPKPYSECMGHCQEEDERHGAEQWRAEGRYWSILVFHNTSAVPQADGIHATPHWGRKFKQKGPEPSTEYICMIIPLRGLTFLYLNSCFKKNYFM